MKLVIIDDDPLVGASLRTILEARGISVLALGNDGSEAVALYKKHKPDILMMDIRMDHVNGIEAAMLVLKADPKAKILFLTTFADDEYIVRALEIGAKGYILKQDFENLIPVLNAVYKGQNVFGNEIVTKLPKLLQETNGFDYEKYNITPKEQEIIRLVTDGMNNKEIADTLFLSEGTVRNYLSHILEKLDLRDRTQLVVFYYQHK
jgi:DNA-binding NarL/FixJ family response regulator